jgi:DNA replication regulator DPB11
MPPTAVPPILSRELTPVYQSLKQYRLPIFAGVILCPSGISDPAIRASIQKVVLAEGGQYKKNLERPVTVTHLLCSGDQHAGGAEKPEKMRYAEKFNERGEARIKMVWEEWFWDSYKHGGMSHFFLFFCVRRYTLTK